MNLYANTKMYNVLDGKLGLSALMSNSPKWIPDYIVKKETYDYMIGEVKSKFKYDLVKPTIAALENNDISLINTEDPRDPEKPIISIPQSFPVIISVLNSKPIAFANVAPKSGYTRTRGTNTITGYNMDVHYFYAMAQRAFVARYLAMNAKKMDTNMSFVKTVTDAFSLVFFKVISKEFGTSAKETWGDKLKFIASCYALENFFNIEPDKAKELALRIQRVNANDIMMNSLFYDSTDAEFDMRSTTNAEYNKQCIKDKKFEETKYPIDALCKALELDFAEMRKESGGLERTIIMKFLEYCSQNAALALENCESFVNFILTCKFNVNIYTNMESKIWNLLKDQTNSIEKIIVAGNN